MAKMVLNDWIRGKIPFFTAPPLSQEEEAIKAAKIKALGEDNLGQVETPASQNAPAPKALPAKVRTNFPILNSLFLITPPRSFPRFPRFSSCLARFAWSLTLLRTT